MLGDEVDAVISVFADSDLPRPERFARSERALFAHLARRGAIYRHALAPRLVEPIRRMLTERLERSLTVYLDRNPDVVPPAPDLTAADAPHRLYAAYGAAGTVGVIEHWLLQGATGDPTAVAHAVIRAAAPWWWAAPPAD